MLIRAWIAVSFSTALLAQQTHTRISQNGATLEWGWQMNPGEDANGHQYTTFVNIPQEHQVLSNTQDNAGQETLSEPLEIYLLPTPTPAADQNFVQIPPTPLPNVQYTSVPSFINGQSQYFIQHAQDENKSDKDVRTNDGSSTPLYDKEDVDSKGKTTSVVTVYKDHNCSNDDVAAEKVAKDSISDLKKYDNPTSEFEAYKTFFKANFDLTENTETPFTYKGAVNFSVEEPSDKYRSERYYYNSDEDMYATEKPEILTKEQLEKLVSSTQDLITNEDLLRINYAVEKHVNPLIEDIVSKPRNLKAKYSIRADHPTYTNNPYNANKNSKPKSTISINSKTGNLVDTSIEHEVSNNNKGQKLHTSNQHEFTSPIIVSDSNYNFKGQIANNHGPTMVPYIKNGYGIVSVKHTYDDRNGGTSSKEIVVTPRPIGQNYLAPITVALRLLNSNVTEIFNSIEDHEGSGSEIVSDTVENPKKLRTIVEVQESLPVEITHINDVEVHEYLNEDKFNDKSIAVTKNLYNIYVDAKQKFQRNMNELLQKYADHGEFEDDSKENLEPSENIRSEVQVRPGEDSDRKEYRHRYNDYEHNRKMIQPIVFEKEVPITHFGDRYIEKSVSYPNSYPVSVDIDKNVEKPVQVTKFVDKSFPVVSHPYPVDVKIPYQVEKKAFFDRPVHVPYPVERIIEKQILHPYPVPTPVTVAVGVQVPVEQQALYPNEKHVPIHVEAQKPVERIVEKEVRVPYAVEKKVPYPVPYETKVPVPYPVERRVPVPVERIVEKPVTVTKFVEKPVRIEVPVPQPIPVAVHVPHPYPVNRVIEKKVPYPVPVDRIVEKRIPIKVPYPVEKLVERIVEKPVVITKFVDKPYPVEKMVPYPVDRIVEKKVPYPVQVPVEIKVPYPVENFQKHLPIKVPYYTEKREKTDERQRDLYNYGYGFDSQPTLYVPQYQKYAQQNGSHQKDRKEKSHPIILSALWGNRYASSYQYINNTKEAMDVSAKNFIKFLNEQNPKEYLGPAPLQQALNQWDNEKIRRTDRVARVANLRIEYGFKPPMVPSTEIDLDGIPVETEEET